MPNIGSPLKMMAQTGSKKRKPPASLSLTAAGSWPIQPHSCRFDRAIQIRPYVDGSDYWPLEWPLVKKQRNLFAGGRLSPNGMSRTRFGCCTWSDLIAGQRKKIYFNLTADQVRVD